MEQNFYFESFNLRDEHDYRAQQDFHSLDHHHDDDDDDDDKCLSCGESQLKTRCSTCNMANYCSSECKKQNWRVHKLICTPSMFPEKKLSGKSVYGLLVDESSQTPAFVEISVPRVSIRGESFENPVLSEFLGDEELGRCVMNKNPYKQNSSMSNALEYRFRENFPFENRMQPNKLIGKLTLGQSVQDWRGPVVVLKRKDAHNMHNPIYIDMSLRDMENLIDFFRHYDQTKNEFFE